MEISPLFEKAAEFSIYLLVFFVGQIMVEAAKRFFFPNDGAIIYKPCPVMDETHIKRFLDSFERMTRAQESTVAMLRRVITLAEEDANKLDAIHHKLFDTRTEGSFE